MAKKVAPPSAGASIFEFMALLKDRCERAGIEFDSREIARAMDSARESPGIVTRCSRGPIVAVHEDGETRVYVDLGTWNRKEMR